MSLHSWIIRTDRHTILVDTCVGNHKTRSRAMWNDLNTPSLDRLSAAGVEPEAVDFVLCTHLHTDHVRSEEHTSELQSLMRILYAVFCLKQKKSSLPPIPRLVL